MYDPGQSTSATTMAWRFAYWLLTAAFVLTATLNLLHVRAGFLTSYLADVTLPALLYVVSRGLGPRKRQNMLMRWLGKTPERAASFFFLASSATEVSQIYWPRGYFAGRYDAWDIVAYGGGLSACYCFDKWEHARLAPRGGKRAAVEQRHAAGGASRRS